MAVAVRGIGSDPRLQWMLVDVLIALARSRPVADIHADPFVTVDAREHDLGSRVVAGLPPARPQCFVFARWLTADCHQTGARTRSQTRAVGATEEPA